MTAQTEKAQHTRGPWRVIGKHVWTATSATGAYDRHIADVYSERPSEGIANARLIAAAPSLLAVLKDALTGLEYLEANAEDAGVRKLRLPISRRRQS